MRQADYASQRTFPSLSPSKSKKIATGAVLVAYVVFLDKALGMKNPHATRQPKPCLKLSSGVFQYSVVSCAIANTSRDFPGGSRKMLNPVRG